MTTLIACDLDRTLIYSSSAIAGPTVDAQNRTAPNRTVPNRTPPERDDLICVEHYDGAPLSFMTTRSSELLRGLNIAAVFVPCTTRTVAQYQRVALPGGPKRYSVTTNGGNILVDGRPDGGWRSSVEARVLNSCAPLDRISTELQRRIDADWVRAFRIAEDLFCYLVVDLARMPIDFVPEWARWCADRNWTVSIQGRKIYSIPATLCKSIAVAEVRRRHELEHGRPCAVLAAGDGALDAELLRYADAAIRPRHGELDAIGFQAPGVAVTSARGIAAGDEILSWMTQMVANPTVTGTELTLGAN